MKMISSDIVEKTWQDVAQFDKDVAEAEMGTMITEQEELIAFVHVISKKVAQDSSELLMYLAFAVYRMFKVSHDGTLPKIDTDLLVTNYEDNFRQLQAQQKDHERVQDQAVELITTNQHDVLKYVVAALSQKGPESIEVNDADFAELFCAVKAIADALDAMTE